MFKKKKDIYEDDDIILEKINYINDGDEKQKTIKKIINIVFYAILTAILLIIIDVVCITKFNIGPFFAIRANVYKDGGTKVYYGIGYKVIKYNQKQGRRNTVIGSWNMPYSTTPTNIKLIDLAIDLENTPEQTYKNIVNKFIRTSGKVIKNNNKNNQLTIQYKDEDGKYTLNVICSLEKSINKTTIKKDKKIYLIGSISKFERRSKTNYNTLYIDDCFVD